MRTLKQLVDEPDLAKKYASAFGEEPELLDVACLRCFSMVIFCCIWNPSVLMGSKAKFNFIQAHSEGLFQKADATLRDCDLNTQAGHVCFSLSAVDWLSIFHNRITLGRCMLAGHLLCPEGDAQHFSLVRASLVRRHSAFFPAAEDDTSWYQL